jgi:hypothetical protein
MKFENYFLLTLLLFGITLAKSQTHRDTISTKPNPFCKTTTINFDIVNKDTVTLAVYNRWGETIQTFIKDSILTSGSFSINFKCDTLVDGVYYLLLKNGIHKQKAIIIVKNCALSTNSFEFNRENIILYPNPTREFVTIPLEGFKTIIVTNLLGQTLIEIGTESKSISLANLTTGTYIISIFNRDNRLLLSKLIEYEK